MITVGNKFPEFELEACVALEAGKEFKMISSNEHKKEGKWMVIFYWPKDFTFVCPTEIIGFSDKVKDFSDSNSVLYGASTDTAFVHLGWRNSHPGLKELKIPMISDHAKGLSSQLGILTGKDQVALRATYIVDPQGTVRWVCINDLSVGRNVEEVIRVLKALQSNELVPCNWKPGEKFIKK